MAIYLDVDIKEKDEAKALGAKWAASRKQWFVPAGVDPTPFAKWFPSFDLLVAPIWLSQSFERCYKCRNSSRVYCLTASAVILNDEVDGIPDEQFIAGPHHISDLSRPDDKIAKIIKELSPSYSLDFSKTKSATAYMNHCEHCRAKLGDFYMHNEPGGAFCPTGYGDPQITRTLILDSGRYQFNGGWGSV